MPLSPNAILVVISYPILTKIEGEPAYLQLQIVQKELNANAAAVPSNLGCGTYGFLILTMTLTAYATVSITPVTVSTNPGA